jgi:hypothetical protein
LTSRNMCNFYLVEFEHIYMEKLQFQDMSTEYTEVNIYIVKRDYISTM